MIVRSLRTAMTALAIAILATGAAPASDTDKLSLGPKVGEKIPHALAASDQAGKTRDFDSLKGKRGLILLFNRSVDWCPYCKAQAMAWNGRLGDARALGYEVAVVTYDTVAKIAAFAESRKVGYAILSDAKSEIIRAFGVLDDSHKPGSFAYGIPRPIIFVLDAKGIVRHRFSEESYRQRPEIDVVLDSIRKSSGRGAEG